jgi:hypothetical protein
MTQEEILEFNEACAEFLGFVPKKYSKTDTTIIWCDKKHGLPVGELLFHSDWNWIMEVVEAIEKLPNMCVYFSKTKLGEHHVEIIHETPTYYSKGKQELDKTFITWGASKKETVVKVINEFLIWYNNE